MKFFDLVKDANQNLLRNKVRTFLTILAIFIGSFTIILSSAINAGVNDFIDKQMSSVGGEGYIEVAPTAMYDELLGMMGGGKVAEYQEKQGSGDTVAITDEDFEKMRKVDGVIRIEPYQMATAEYIRREGEEKKFRVSLTLSPSDSLKTDMVEGRQVETASEKLEVMINEDYVEALGFSSNADAVGKEVVFGVKQPIKCYLVQDVKDCIGEVKMTITGVQAPSVMSMAGGVRTNNAGNNAVYDLYAEGVDEVVKNRTSMAIGEVEPEKIESVKKELRELGFEVVTLEDEIGMIKAFFDVILAVFNIFGGIALLAAAIGIINTLFMSVEERTREIGLDKALGMSSFKVFLAFSIEAISLGFWGSVFGIIVSMGVGYGINTLVHAEGAFLEAFPTFTLVKFTPETILPIVLIIMLIAFIAGTVPAIKAAKKNPIDSLRYE